MATSTGLVLGIESSCDETAAAVVQGARVRSSVIASQHDLHEQYRGVVPEIASRAHAQRILPVIDRALEQAGCRTSDLRAVAVGHRPGLIGSLLVGVSAAKALAWSLGVPIIAVDHVHAHLYAGCLSGGEGEGARALDPAGALPALGLVISGGHTSVYLLEDFARPVRLGATIDDAIGEAYDKLASLLGLGFPGGPLVDKLARTGNDRAIDFPLSRLSPTSLDFSFSGLKTAALYAWQGVPHTRGNHPPPPHTPPAVADLCASFQRACAQVLVLKLQRALAHVQGARPAVRPCALLVGGGVSANSRIRAELADFAAENDLALALPALDLCVDNAAMIAGLGAHLLERRGWTSDPLHFPAVPTTAL
jgi:N6-L-threonylcarbamoyladenine synthase